MSLSAPSRMTGSGLLRPALAWVLILAGAWMLPNGYVTGVETSTDPYWLRITFGFAGIASGVGLLQRQRWAPWPGVLFLLTQLTSVHVPGYVREPMLFFGFNFNAPTTGETVQLGINAPAFILLVFLCLFGFSRSASLAHSSAPGRHASAHRPARAPTRRRSR